MGPDRLAPWLSSLAQRWDGTALEVAFGGGAPDRLSFRELEAKSQTFSRGLSALGLERGDSIAIWLPSTPLWLAVHFGAARFGLTTIPLNTWYREVELEHFLVLGSARLLLVDSAFLGIDFPGILTRVLERGNCASIRWVIDVSGKIRELPNVAVLGLDALTSAEKSNTDVEPENPAMIGFATSGTTGLPKLAMHREGALVRHGRAVAERAGMNPGEVVLGALPPCGAYGYTLLIASLAAGARAIQLERFDIDRLVELIESEQVNVMAVTEPILRDLLDHPRATPKSLRSLRLVFSAGATLGPIVERADREFGFRITNVYGSSEVLALAAFWDPNEDTATRSQAGGELVSEGMEVSVVDSAGHALGAGISGELRFRGPIVTSGYLQNPAATADAFTGDGWFLSNDLGQLVDGHERQFRYIARMNDALRLRGFLVNPGEIEARLQAHAAVLAAQVVGVPDGRGEDRAVAFVTLNPGTTASEEDLRAFCRTGMASYKTPAAIRILEKFPTTRSANGDKVVKRRLREMAQEMDVQ